MRTFGACGGVQTHPVHPPGYGPETPGWGGGRTDPGKFDVFTRVKVPFSTPEHQVNVKFPRLGNLFCPKQVLVIIIDI